MPVIVRCPHCSKPVKTSRELLGQKLRCASCNQDFKLVEKSSSSGSSLMDEVPAPRPSPAFDETLSRSMLPVRGGYILPADDLVCRIEPRTLRWLNASETVLDFLGKTIEQLRQKTFPESLHPDDRALAEDEFRKAIEMGERHDFVLRLPNGAGKMRYVRVYTQARYNADGTVNHIRAYLKDITEGIQADQELRRRTEQLTTTNEQLRQSNQKLKETQSQLVHSEKLAALGKLAAGMAHEINNPLAFAMNNVSVLGREIGDLLRLVELYQQGWDILEQARPELAETIRTHQDEVDLTYLRENLPRMTDATRTGLQRVAKIVENLRGFAQLDRSELAVIDVNVALDQSIGMLADSLSEQKISVRRHYEPVPPLECAALHLNQVFLNLMMNSLQAIEATGRKSGRIKLATRSTGEEIVVEISDDGCGIPPDVIPKIFDPFFTTQPIGKGTGLGLSISHGIIHEHGGHIKVESGVGVGTRFLIHLPLVRNAKKTPA